MANCAQEILKAVPDASPEEIARVVAHMESIRRRSMASDSFDSAYREDAMAYLNGYRRAVLKTKIKALANIKKSAAIEARASNIVWEEVVNSKVGINRITGTFDTGRGYGLYVELKGSNTKDVPGARDSTQARIHGNFNRLASGFLREVTPEHLDILSSKALNEQIFEEVYQYSMKDKGTPGITGSETAKAIGLAVHHLNQARLDMLRKSGALVDEYEGYVVANLTDSEKATKLGYDAWKKSIYQNFDVDKSIKRANLLPEDAEGFLESIYKNMTENKPDALLSDDSDNVIKIIGTPSNMAKRLERGRVLHPKSGAAQYTYLKEFGSDDLLNTILRATESTARNAALIEKWGTNPRATFERKIKSESPQTQAKLMSVWKHLDGSGAGPARAMIAKIDANTRALNNATMLGTGFIAQFPDTVNRFTNLVATNKTGVFNATESIVLGTMKGFTGAERLKVARLTGLGAAAFLGKFQDRFSADDYTPGLAAKANKITFAINLMNRVTDAQKAAHGEALVAELGENAGDDWSSLPTAKNLTRYGFGEPEWNFARKGIETVDGQPYLTLDAVEKIPTEEVIEFMSQQKILREGVSKAQEKLDASSFRNSVVNKLSAYYIEETGVAMSEPGAAEKAMWYNADTKNTVGGAVARNISQFKMFMTAMTTKTVDDLIIGEGGRTWIQSLFSGKSNYAGLATLMIGSMLTSYVADSMKKIVKNEDPLNANDPETWVKMLKQGGSFGFMGDFVLGDFNSRHGVSALSSLAGPTAGRVNDFIDLYNKLKRGEKTGEDALKMLYKTVPYANGLIWTQVPINFFLIHQAQEFANPGHIRRTKSKMRKEGRQYILDPNR